jgi:PAS domain S-box-containing protein
MTATGPNGPADLSPLFDALPGAVIVTDADGRISYWNEAAATLYGWRPSEVMGISILDLTVPDIGQDEAALVMGSLERGEPWAGHFRVKRRDGIEFRALVRNIPLLGDDGRVSAIVGLSEPVTDDLLFQQTFDLAMRVGRLGIWEWDVETNRVSWSASLEAVYGLEPGSFGGWWEDVLRRFHPEDRERVVQEIRGALADRAELRFEHRIEHPDGQLRWLETRGEPVVGDSGRVRVVRGVSIDITERKAAEARAAARERQEAAVADLGREALTGRDVQALAERAVAVAADVLEVEFARVLRVNDDQTTFTVDAGVGWLPDIVGSTSSDDGLDHARYTLGVGQPVVIEDLPTERRFRPPQVLLDHGIVSGISMVIRGSVRPWGVFGVHTSRARRFGPDDVYFVRSMANVLGLAMDAHAAADNRDAFISLVSHELRNPLTTVLGYASLLQRRTNEMLALPDATALDAIVREARRMASTLQLLLDLARLDSGQLTTELGEVKIEELVGSEVAALRLRSPDLQIEERYSADGISVHTDRDRIAQILTNLLDNAAKYGRGQVWVHVATQDNGVEVAVRDDGPGIASAEVPHIFERFYRAAQPGGEAAPAGSGLGLYISQQIAQRLGASITYGAPDAGGSIFCLTIPSLIDVDDRPIAVGKQP